MKGNRGSGALRRLKADETVKVRFLEEPGDWYKAFYHWLGTNFLWCNKQKSCPGCKTGDRAKMIVLANVVIISSDDDKEAMKVVVMQMAPTLATTLFKFYEKRNTILDRDYDLTREGSGMNDTVYSADPDDPKRRNLSRFEDSIHDVAEIIASEIGEDDESDNEEDEEEPRSSKKKSSRRRDDDDDYEDEDEDDDKEEEEQDDFSGLDRSELKQAIKKIDPDFVAKKSQSDEDIRAYLWDLSCAEKSEEEEEEEEERPAKSKKSKSSGLTEFKKPSSSKTRTVVRRSR